MLLCTLCHDGTWYGVRFFSQIKLQGQYRDSIFSYLADSTRATIGVTAAAISPDGNLLATGDYHGDPKVWRMKELFGD